MLHDYLYVAWQSVPHRAALRADRLFADRVMLAAMQVKGVSRWRRWVIYAAVRLGGGRSYRMKSPFRFGDATDPRLIHLAAVPDLVTGEDRITLGPS